MLASGQERATDKIRLLNLYFRPGYAVLAQLLLSVNAPVYRPNYADFGGHFIPRVTHRSIIVGPALRSGLVCRKVDNCGTVLQSELEQLAGLSVQLDYRRSFWADTRANSADNPPYWYITLPIRSVISTSFYEAS